MAAQRSTELEFRRLALPRTLLRRYLAKTVCPRPVGLLNGICPCDPCGPFPYYSLIADLNFRLREDSEFTLVQHRRQRTTGVPVPLTPVQEDKRLQQENPLKLSAEVEALADAPIRRENSTDVAQPTDRVVLTFRPNTERPNKINLGFTRHEVTKYIEEPPRCFNCQQYHREVSSARYSSTSSWQHSHLLYRRKVSFQSNVQYTLTTSYCGVPVQRSSQQQLKHYSKRLSTPPRHSSFTLASHCRLLRPPPSPTDREGDYVPNSQNFA
ncbi:hypothetical protein HPB47_025270 [Ixodes persulcatus]|uniref:Uncharacterized protein n=1 Tax=Ixodes persulcatus TaxID=34615 RepID=A0AC60Q3T1_IXOPE|nr:hypothetical protein HPB47_025270 [Ixodes persulcatus]